MSPAGKQGTSAPVEPANVDAEEAVLGACLISTAAADTATQMLEPSHFWRETHGSIFAAIRELRQRGDPVEPLIVASELERLGVLASVGGRAKLSELAASVTAASNVGHYIALVLDAARSRRVYRATLAVQKAALNGGLALHPELLDELEVALADARTLPGEPSAPDTPIFVDAFDFVAERSDPVEPLWGSKEIALIDRGGFVLLCGRPGCGKTTFVLDLACHLAAGVPYPPRDEENKRAPTPWPVPRPVKIALIENEGPKRKFQDKLAAKLASFPHPIREVGGRLVVQTWAWGSFSFADRSYTARIRRELDELEIDLVIGDPLALLGLEGVGSPAETRAFLQTLLPLGLTDDRAFLFLHHFRERVEKTEDELARISGAWGGHLDTLLTLMAAGAEDQVRLNCAKVRWVEGKPPEPIILGKIWAKASFEALAIESDASFLEPAVHAYLTRSREENIGHRAGWQTAQEIARGMKARASDVRAALAGAPHLFTSVSGADAKALGAKRSNTVLWGLSSWPESGEYEDAEDLREEQGRLDDDGIPF